MSIFGNMTDGNIKALLLREWLKAANDLVSPKSRTTFGDLVYNFSINLVFLNRFIDPSLQGEAKELAQSLLTSHATAGRNATNDRFNTQRFEALVDAELLADGQIDPGTTGDEITRAIEIVGNMALKESVITQEELSHIKAEIPRLLLARAAYRRQQLDANTFR